ncbi:MAG: deoxyribonuclease IV [Asgard group archaeon]|nr:deoxyribonuclease IV [Asgard group archaeon]
MKFGVHISIAGGIEKAVTRAKKIGCDTFQIFTTNPRSWKEKELTNQQCENFNQKLKRTDMQPIFAHMAYLCNLTSHEEEIWRKSIKLAIQELKRCECLKIPYLVIHPGSSKGKGKEYALKRILESISTIFESFHGKTKLIIENITNKRLSLGCSLEDIGEIINKSVYEDKLGFCLDTCHAFASGYDFRQEETINQIISITRNKIGVKKLVLIHSNDSKYDLATGRDQHEHIGLGKIGYQGFENILQRKLFRKIPFICETPVDGRRNDSENIHELKKLLIKITKR